MREVAVSASSWKESWRGRFTSEKEERDGLAGLEYVVETTRKEGDGLVKGDGIGQPHGLHTVRRLE